MSALAAESDQPISSDAGPCDLAYVIYTSGSTGKPKGVQLEHRSVVNFQCSMRRQHGLDSNDALLAVTTLSFDIADLEIFLPLVVGARLVVASREATVDGTRLKKLLQDSRATVLQATPTTWRLLFESGWSGDRHLKVLVGGEALPPELARKFELRNSCVVKVKGLHRWRCSRQRCVSITWFLLQSPNNHPRKRLPAGWRPWRNHRCECSTENLPG